MDERDEMSRQRERRRRRRWSWVLAACLLAAAIYLMVSGIEQKQRAKKAKPPVPPTPVSVAHARRGEMPVYLTGLGTVVPLNTVTVRSRVDGQLMAVLYREGQLVKKGALLATIDPRPFQVQLAQAQGQMERDREQLKNAELDLLRFRQLWQQNSIASQQLDTQEALVRQLKGVIRFDQAQIDNARLLLTYSRITAPISGRVGLRQVDPGNIVHAADTNGLVVITQLQPITVLFPIAEDSLPPVLAQLKAGATLAVEAFDRDMKQRLAAGRLLTVDNLIDPATGTVKLKAVFANASGELFPNQFVNARLLVNVVRDAVIVPAVSIQRGPQGSFVYVVNGDHAVALRPVTIGVSEGGRTQVTTGLNGGELVVTDGAERLRQGSRVDVKTPS